MCSSPKGSAATTLKKVPVTTLSSSDLSDFVAVANTADERREQRVRNEKARALRGERARRKFS